MRSSICTSVNHLDLNIVSSTIVIFFPECYEFYCLTDTAQSILLLKFILLVLSKYKKPGLKLFINDVELKLAAAGTPSNDKILRNKNIILGLTKSARIST